MSMTVETASKLLPAVNAPNFEAGISMYVGERMEAIHREMRTTTNVDRWKELKGQALELERLALLRRDVISMTRSN